MYHSLICVKHIFYSVSGNYKYLLGTECFTDTCIHVIHDTNIIDVFFNNLFFKIYFHFCVCVCDMYSGT